MRFLKILGLCVFGVIFLQLLVNGGASPSPQEEQDRRNRESEAAIAAASEAARPRLAVGKWQWSRTGGGGFYEVEGQVTNITNEPLENVKAVVTFTDKNGQFVTSDDALIDYTPLMPGQKSPWKVLTRYNPAMESASVEFATLRGVVLPYTQTK